MAFETVMPITSELKLFWKYARELRPYFFPLSVSFLSDAFSIVLEMISPLLSILIFDYAYVQRNLSLLTATLLAGLAIYFVRFFFSSATDYNHLYIDQTYTASLSSKLLGKILRLPVHSQSKSNLGDLTVRIMDDTDLAAGMIVNTLSVLFASS
ncbi:MAG: hypothetical protein HYW02_06740, partial [Deltaproteobacteria bacterium]|nr:hypothetical protein [Deltaproteobacteria bacterium]